MLKGSAVPTAIMVSSYKTICFGLITVLIKQFLLIVCKRFTFERPGRKVALYISIILSIYFIKLT